MRRLLWSAVLLSHPVLVVALALTMDVRIWIPAQLLDYVLCAVALVSLGTRWTAADAPVETVHERSFALRVGIAPRLAALAFGLVGSTTTWGLLAYYVADRYGVHIAYGARIPVERYILHFGVWLFMAMTLGLLMSFATERRIVLRGRRLMASGRQAHLSGSSELVWGDGVLTVRDGDEAVVLRGPPHTLRWVAEQIEAIEPLGGEDDVPEGLRGLLRAHPTEQRHT